MSHRSNDHQGPVSLLYMSSRPHVLVRDMRRRWKWRARVTLGESESENENGPSALPLGSAIEICLAWEMICWSSARLPGKGATVGGDVVNGWNGDADRWLLVADRCPVLCGSLLFCCRHNHGGDWGGREHAHSRAWHSFAR